MKTIILVLVFLISTLTAKTSLCQNHVKIEGKTVISIMNKDNTADSVVVKLADGTLGLRHLSTMGDADSDPTNEIETWSTLAGIPAGFSDNIDDVGIAFETDPQVGLLINGLWCISNGASVNCNQLLPDNSAFNEIQTLSILNNTISLSNGGGSIILPEDMDAGWVMESDTVSTSKNVGIGTDSPVQILTLLEQGAANPVGITQGQVAGGSAMELTTSDADGDQATRLLFHGASDNTDVQFYRGGRGAEQLTMIIAGANGNVGIGTGGAPSDKFQVGTIGDGTIARANGWNLFSDRRWKKELFVIDDPIEKLNAISGYYYYWKEGKDDSRQVGVIAQEIEKVLPEVVSTDKEGYKSVEYGKLSALLIEVVKEQQSEINLLKDQLAGIEDLRNQLNHQNSLIEEYLTNQ